METMEHIMEKLNRLRDKIESFIILIVKEIKETSKNCDNTTKF
jgi:hypothetical protein